MFFIFICLANAIFNKGSQRKLTSNAYDCVHGLISEPSARGSDQNCQTRLTRYPDYEKELCKWDAIKNECYWDDEPNAAKAIAICVVMFVLWSLLVISFGSKNCCPETHEKFCGFLYKCSNREESSELQIKFLDGEPDLIPGNKWGSFWMQYKCADPFLGTFLIEKSHYSNHTNKAITVLFLMTYGMFVDLIIDEVDGDPPLKIMAVTIPNTIFWGPLMDWFNKRELKKELHGEETGCINKLDKVKNGGFLLLSFLCFILVIVALAMDSLASPNDYIASYFFVALVFPIVLNAIINYVGFLFAWHWVVDKEKETPDTCLYTAMFLAGFLPKSLQGESTEARKGGDNA